MLTFKPTRQLPTHAPAELEARRLPARDITRVTTFDDFISNADRDDNRPPEPTSIQIRTADAQRLLMQDLEVADAAISEGRINVAHDALIHAQDIAFDIHFTLCSAGIGNRGSSTGIPLELTNRLIDANRTKDRTILAECRALVDRLSEVGETVGMTPASSADLARSNA